MLKRTVTFIGATTENPYFEVIKALVSRSRIFELQSLTEADLRRVAEFALSNDERGYGRRDVRVDDDALDHLVSTANGDARSLLNALELAAETTPEGESVTLEVAEESIQKRAVLYDKEGDAHYDTISAFIKSLRGSDPDASMYWMGRMLYAGEDPRFIIRRMLIFAAEDIGLADPGPSRWPPHVHKRLSGWVCPRADSIWPSAACTWPRHPRATQPTRFSTRSSMSKMSRVVRCPIP